MKESLIIIYSLLSLSLYAQTPTQSIRGKINDKQSKLPLIGATVSINTQIATLTDVNGQFLLQNVPVGAYQLNVSYIGYEPLQTERFLLQSTRETYLEIELIEGSITGEEIVISANRNAFEPLNELSAVSTRSFTTEELDRLPASLSDPGRAALSYPGVQVGADDSENQIVVRGNSPVGILWRLEGIDIPNPNHFAVVGSSGGGVTVFSAQLIAKSDFSTGGFAAEYGNALSGAFDINFRPGNFHEKEHRVKIGVLGLDFATEGPIKEGKSSYLLNYRYSTLGLLSSVGINLVGERVSNNFQDLSFNLVFNGENNRSVTTVFGMGGLSEEVYSPVEDPLKRDLTRANHSEDRARPANMAAIGVTNTLHLKNKAYLKTVVAIMGSDIRRMDDTLSIENQRFRYNTEQYIDKRLATSISYNQKLNDYLIFKTGLIGNLISFDFQKVTMARNNSSDINEVQTNVSLQGHGNTNTFQHYSQFSLLINSKIRLNTGYHYLRLGVNNASSLEPRFSLQITPKTNQKLSLSYGRNSQIPSLMNYFYQKDGSFVNRDLGLMKAEHTILAYHIYTKNKMKLSLETYLQRLSNIPAAESPGSGSWLLNGQGNLNEYKLLSEGKGLNYGVDVAVEKSFSNSYYLLLTGSLLDASYQMPDGRAYNSRYNSRFSSSATMGKEFYLKNGGVLQVGGRFLLKGGIRYTPHDPILSAEKGRYINQVDSYYSAQVPVYSRLDSRVAYSYNKPKLSGKIQLDIQNILDHKNPIGLGYDSINNETYLRYGGSGLIPVISFQFDI